MDSTVLVPHEVVRRNVDSLGIRYDELASLPFWSPLSGTTQDEFKVRIAAKVIGGSILARRELSQPERQAIAQHYAKLMATQHYTSPIALGASIVLFRHTYKSYGFPFWTPKVDKFNPNKFGPLPEGLPSQRAWHVLRGIAWYTCFKVAAFTFISSYAYSVYMARYSLDPQLKDFHDDVRATVLQRQPAVARLHGQSPPPPGVAGPSSPPSPWTDTEQATEDAKSSWPETQTPQPETSQSSSFSDDSHIFDDASPIAPSEQQRGTPQQSTQGGSAWDRIRGQARRGSGTQGQGQTGVWGQRRQDELTSQGARDGTSYNFSSADEEKAYAKEQAQKEFDEMLERERRGIGDGSSRR